MSGRLQYVACVSRVVFVHGDMLPVRIMLANASLFMTAALLTDASAFDRPVYVVLAKLMPQWAWVLAFLLHAIGEYARLFDPKRRIGMALAINIYGFMLWFVSTAGISFAIGSFAPTVAMDWSMVLASGWALFRTGHNRSLIAE